MTVLVTLTVYGSDVGPFDIYSNPIDGNNHGTFIIGGILLSQVIAPGYTVYDVPDDTTVIRLLSTGDCDNYIDIVVGTTTTTSSTSTSTTTSTSTSTTTTTTTAVPCELYDTFDVRLSDAEIDHCSEQSVAVFVAQGLTITTGVTVYTDCTLTQPVSGSYISEQISGVIYNISVGVIGSVTGNSC
jgi:hypothetical protein